MGPVLGKNTAPIWLYGEKAENQGNRENSSPLPAITAPSCGMVKVRDATRSFSLFATRTGPYSWTMPASRRQIIQIKYVIHEKLQRRRVEVGISRGPEAVFPRPWRNRSKASQLLTAHRLRDGECPRTGKGDGLVAPAGG